MLDFTNSNGTIQAVGKKVTVNVLGTKEQSNGHRTFVGTLE